MKSTSSEIKSRRVGMITRFMFIHVQLATTCAGQRTPGCCVKSYSFRREREWLGGRNSENAHHFCIHSLFVELFNPEYWRYVEWRVWARNVLLPYSHVGMWIHHTSISLNIISRFVRVASSSSSMFGLPYLNQIFPSSGPSFSTDKLECIAESMSIPFSTTALHRCVQSRQKTPFSVIVPLPVAGGKFLPQLHPWWDCPCLLSTLLRKRQEVKGKLFPGKRGERETIVIFTNSPTYRIFA